MYFRVNSFDHTRHPVCRLRERNLAGTSLSLSLSLPLFLPLPPQSLWISVKQREEHAALLSLPVYRFLLLLSVSRESRIARRPRLCHQAPNHFYSRDADEE